MTMTNDIRDVALRATMIVEGTISENGDPGWTVIEGWAAMGVGIIQFSNSWSFRLIREIYVANGNDWKGSNPTAEIKNAVEANQQWGYFTFTSTQEISFVQNFIGTEIAKGVQKRLAYEYIDQNAIAYMNSYNYDYSSDEEHQRMGCFAVAVAVVGGAGALAYPSVVAGYNTNTLLGFYNGVNADPIVGAANGYANRNLTLYNFLNNRDMSQPSGINWGSVGETPAPPTDSGDGNSQDFENQENGVYDAAKLEKISNGWTIKLSQRMYGNGNIVLIDDGHKRIHFKHKIPDTDSITGSVNDQQNDQAAKSIKDKLNELTNEQLSSIFKIMVDQIREDASTCFIKKYSTGKDRLDTPSTADTTSYIYYCFFKSFNLNLGKSGSQMISIAKKSENIHLDQEEWQPKQDVISKELNEGEIVLINDGAGKMLGCITLDDTKSLDREIAVVGVYGSSGEVCYPKIVKIGDFLSKVDSDYNEFKYLTSIDYFKEKEITNPPSGGGGSGDVSGNLQQIAAYIGSNVYNAQCYGLVAFYVDTFPVNGISLGCGSPRGLQGVIGDTINAYAIGDSYDWASAGWTVYRNPRDINMFKAGYIINWAAYTPIGITQYGHTGIISKVTGNTISVYEQNHDPTIQEYDYDASYLMPQISSTIAPP